VLFVFEPSRRTSDVEDRKKELAFSFCGSLNLLLLTGAHFYFMPKLLKISENEYRVSGEVDARFPELKTVTVDGVEYSRTDYIERIFSYDDDFNKSDRFSWQKIEISEF
jgi:hypothetical protein